MLPENRNLLVKNKATCNKDVGRLKKIMLMCAHFPLPCHAFYHFHL